MNFPAIFASFREHQSDSVRDALDSCLQQPELATPEFRQALKNFADHPELLAEEAARHELSCVMIYLAWQRDQNSWDELLRLICQEDFKSHLAENTWLLLQLHRVLASMFNFERLPAIAELTLNQNVAAEVREAALLTYTFLMQEGLLTEKQLLDEYRQIFAEAMKNNLQDDARLWVAATIQMTAIGGQSSRPLVNNILESGLLQDQTAFVRKLANGICQTNSEQFQAVFKKGHQGYFQDLDTEIEKLFAPPEKLEQELPGRGHTQVRAEAKIGRNDPCPCNSGKKYKKCCGK